jgi:hypothetical protein
MGGKFLRTLAWAALGLIVLSTASAGVAGWRARTAPPPAAGASS